MPTYILTKSQKELLVEALDEYRERLTEEEDIKSAKILSAYLDNPYSGSWMGKDNIR
jgi:hypothetical protein